MPIEAINGNEKTNSKELYEMMLKLMGQDSTNATETEKVISQMTEILAREGLKISTNGTNGAKSASGIQPIANGPTLKTSGTDKAITTELLEKLIAFLMMKSTDKQIELSRKRIEGNQAEISARHQEQVKKLDESIQKAKEAEKQKRRRKIFGWLFAIVAVVVAAVVCVATGGLAVGPVVGALLAVGSAVLTQTDCMEKLQEKLMKHLMEKHDMDKKEAMKWAGIIMLGINLAVMAVTAALTGGASAGEAFQTAMKALKVVSLGLTAANAYTSFESTFTNKAAADAQVDLTLLNKILQQLQQRMDEEEEELKKLIDLLQSSFTGLASLIEKDANAMDEISAKLGAMGV